MDFDLGFWGEGLKFPSALQEEVPGFSYHLSPCEAEGENRE